MSACKTCDGLGEWEEFATGRDYTRRVICPDCEGTGGHNDPRGLARETLEKLGVGEKDAAE